MSNELLTKIQHVFDGRFTNEMKVVYLLVELRKLMDHARYRNPILRTFSNWVGHTSLEKYVEGSSLILKEFDDLFEDLYSSQKVPRRREHISLLTFRQALIDCFDHFGLSAPFVHDLSKWKQFSKFYCMIVGECPIVFTASRNTLRHITKVELRQTERGPILKQNPSIQFPTVQWKVFLRDGSSQYWSFQLA